MFSSFRRRVRRFWWRLGDSLFEARRRFVKAAGWPFRVLAWPFTLVYKGLRAWNSHARWRRLLYGLPSLLLATLGGYLWAKSYAGNEALANDYNLAADEAFANEKFETAKLLYERVVQLEPPGEPATLFRLAEAAQQVKDWARVEAIIELLAPVDRPVHAPAHYWQAMRLLAGGRPTAGQVQQAQVHFRHMLTINEADPIANSMLGDLYAAQGAIPAAISHLERAVEAYPKTKFRLAQLYAAQGDADNAVRCFQDMQAMYDEMCRKDPTDVAVRMKLVECEASLGEYPKAAATAADGLKIQGHPELAKLLSDVLVAWADSLTGTPQARTRQFELLSQAITAAPESLTAYDRLAGLLADGDDVSRKTHQFLIDNIAEGRCVAVSHLILGTAAYGGGDPDAARVHFERARALLPDASLIANNLAWLLIYGDQADPQRALRIIDPVVAASPEVPRFRDTRGHALYRLGRWQEAVDDLEFALRAVSENAQSHAALADCYTQLGALDLAEAHRKLAAPAQAGQSAPPSRPGAGRTAPDAPPGFVPPSP